MLQKILHELGDELLTVDFSKGNDLLDLGQGVGTPLTEGFVVGFGGGSEAQEADQLP